MTDVYWLKRVHWWVVLTWHELSCAGGFTSEVFGDGEAYALCRTCRKTWRSGVSA